MEDVVVNNAIITDWDEMPQFDVSGGKLGTELTTLGKKIKIVFKNIKLTK